MGEHVTDAELAQWDESPLGGEFSPREVNRKVRALVAEVRRLRAENQVLGDNVLESSRGFVRGYAMGGRANIAAVEQADAAGYARAERDVVAHVEAVVARHALNRDRHSDGTDAEQAFSFRAAMCMAAAEEIAVHLKSGAHRGAAKNEAPRGEGE